ncbi:hypothetical protein DX116_14685 [Aeromicrobium endophyticum]|uniref:Pyrrolo-quinoline quinone repeat domain-containing protein n=1 Tax=Aeromicrobium endophyticum TaxID=2292704 RepID=A0A371P4N5_9ACTN|nr:hypothetical protein DX116_14685 [Aeromicrobium endophyticum]
MTAVAVALALALGGCTGGGDDDRRTSDDEKAAGLPLPKKAPSARGPATGPALEPKVLLASSDALEQQAGSIDTAQVDRRSGAFISGSTVVGYSIDDVSGYSLTSGEQLWTSDLDLGGGTVCFVSEPDRAVKTFTIAYGESSFCSKLATVRVKDGKVLKLSERLSESVEFEGGRTGGSVDQLFTVDGRDHLIDSSGVVWEMKAGEPDPVARLEARSYFDIYPTPKGDMLIGSRLSDRGRCRVDGYALPSFEHVWTSDTATLFPEVREDCVISVAAGNSALLMQETTEGYSMVQVDPATGTVVGRGQAPKDSSARTPKGQFDLAGAALHLDQTFGLPGGDTVFAQLRGLTRYSLETGKVVWDLDLDQLQLESTEEYPLTTVLPHGVTADGYLVASVSNDTAAELVAVDVKTGELAGRWAVPSEYRNGFQVDPGLDLFSGGVVLTRNFEAYDRAFADYLEVPKPEGDLYDIGVFTFPKPDDSAASDVPTAGPTDVDVKALGGLGAPADADPKAGRDVGAVRTGSLLVAYAGNTLTGIDPKTGDQSWTTTATDDPGASVCTAPEPDRKVATLLLGVRSREGAACDSLVAVDVAKGTVTDRVALPASAKSVARIEVVDGVQHVVTGDRRISRVEGGALVPIATLARQPYYFERTPQDPTLVIATTSLKDGRDWAIDAYRLPNYEPVWQTTAKKVFGKVDRENYVNLARGNGLVASTTFGDVSDTDATVKDVLVALDPATGAVTSKVGPLKRDYLADDPAQLSLSDAVVSSYESVGFDDGDIAFSQKSGIVRYSPVDQSIVWSVDTRSMVDAMERDRSATTGGTSLELIDGGRTVLVVTSNDVSVELMTLDAAKGTVTGRWNVPAAARNGLQASPDVVPVAGNVALVHDDYSWEYAMQQSGRQVPSGKRWDVGLFSLPGRKAAAK